MAVIFIFSNVCRCIWCAAGYRWDRHYIQKTKEFEFDSPIQRMVSNYVRDNSFVELYLINFGIDIINVKIFHVIVDNHGQIQENQIV